MAIVLTNDLLVGTLTDIFVDAEIFDNRSNLTSLASKMYKSPSRFGWQDRYITTNTIPTGDYTDNKIVIDDYGTPGVYEETLKVTQRKYWATTLNQFLVQGAFLNEGAISNFFSYLLKAVQDSRKKWLEDVSYNLLFTYAPDDTYNPIDVVELPNTTDNVAIGLATAERLKYWRTRFAFANSINDINFTQWGTNNVYIVMSYELAKIFQLYAPATLYHDNYLDATNVIVIPNELVPDGKFDTPLFFYIIDDEKFIIKDYVNTVDNFHNGRTLSDTTFIHHWIKSGSLRGKICKVVTIELVEP